MIKIDLHTHSVKSRDGGITAQQYIKLLEDGVFDCIAITDHNTIDLARELQATLGEKIIVGEEISTKKGEIIGLFLDKAIAPGKSLEATVNEIKERGGLVYVPHPLETVRSGLSMSSLDAIAENIDIVEVHNGRAVFQNKGPEATKWARIHNKSSAASSDAHGKKGIGTTYTMISAMPTKSSLVKLLETARFATNRPPLRSLLYPKFHRLKGKVGLKK